MLAKYVVRCVCLSLSLSAACAEMEAPFEAHEDGGGKPGSAEADAGGGRDAGRDAGERDAGERDGGESPREADGDVEPVEAGEDAAVADGLRVSPEPMQRLVVEADRPLPTLSFEASLDGEPVSAAWDVERGELGSIDAGPASSAVFTPSGRVGGLVRVRAGFNGEVVEREVFVEVVESQNGADASSERQARQIAHGVPEELTAGGGIGGVGGEGLGAPVDDEDTVALLDEPTDDGSAQHLEWLYPYDGTVWPRGLLAPLLMWRSDLGSVDAVEIELRTRSGSYQYSGTFGPPAILAQTGAPFIRHPIPQDAWEAATDTAGGPTPDDEPDTLEVRLTVAKDGKAYGPLTQTWTVAPARLSGTIYYGSYGTNLAKNYGGAVGGDGMFGGAVLSIRVGDTEPSLVAGGDGGQDQCRACHAVAGDGSRLLALPLSEASTSMSDLGPGGVAAETIFEPGARYPGLTSDGRYALTRDAQLLDLESDGAAVTVDGLANVVTQLGPPAFSHDDERVVFNPTASPSLTPTWQSLVAMDVDLSTLTFSNPVTLVDNSGGSAGERPGWPSFTPDGAVVYQQQVQAGDEGQSEALHTRRGARSHLAWTPADASHPVPLDRANGIAADGSSYLPSLAAPVSLECRDEGLEGPVVGDIAADHADDANLNYEPTVNPVPAGGFSWVVFTSRRMYGSVATIPPFCSDPRGVDLIQNITTKKLWVAALDLNGEPGEDISHPAFYLPAQELLAGNTRGSWVLDPCRPDGESCETGDQCCNGFCSAGEDGELMCSNEPPDQQCAETQERCETAADCCDPQNECINGFCAMVSLQ